MTTFRHLSDSFKTRQHQQAFEVQGKTNYADWWQAIRDVLLQADSQKYGEMFADRESRFANRQRGFGEPIHAIHEAALLNAGFTEVGPIWQHVDDCVLLGVRGPDQKPISN